MKPMNKTKAFQSKKKRKQPKTKKQRSVFKQQWKSFSDWYKTFCYRIIGKRLTEKRDLDRMSQKLRMANVRFTPGIYLSTIILTSILVTIISFVIFYILFGVFIGASSWPLYVTLLTALSGGIALGFFPLIVSSKISTRRRQINHELPFILSELSILAGTGITPIKILRHMAERGGTVAVKNEFKRIVHKIDIEGKDIITALSETANETPSPQFRETLWDLGNMIHQGGDLDVYLRQKADSTMDIKRDMQKEFIDKLGTYSEMYMSLVLTGTIFLAIAAFLIDAMQTSVAGLTAEMILLLLAYLLVPVIIVVVNVIISMAYARSG
jgi:flagellar protein FlaJ